MHLCVLLYLPNEEGRTDGRKLLVQSCQSSSFLLKLTETLISLFIWKGWKIGLGSVFRYENEKGWGVSRKREWNKVLVLVLVLVLAIPFCRPRQQVDRVTF
jgi:hypothetical protein